MQFHTVSASKLTENLRQGTISSVHVTQHFIQRIEALDPQSNIVVTRLFTQALALAQQRDEIPIGSRGPLHGLPLTVKSEFHVQGVVCTCGDPTRLTDPPAPSTHPLVQRLIDAGAIILGLTNVPLHCKDWQTYNAIHGVTPNPWNHMLSAGGSSGGSAVALALGLTPLELGGDAAGSIRVPANFCGVVGHSTTRSLLVLPSTAHPIATVGPMARSVEDLQLMLPVLIPKKDTLLLLNGPWRIAMWKDTYPNSPTLEQDVVTSLNMIEQMIQTSTHRLVTNVPPIPQDSLSDYMLLLNLKPHEAGHTKQYWEDVFEKEVFQHCDAIVMPVAPTTAFVSMPIEGQDAYTPNVKSQSSAPDSIVRAYSDYFFWPHFAILADLPATAIRTGLTDGGSRVPVGVQVMCRKGQDMLCLNICRWLENCLREMKGDEITKFPF
eukprot:PhF_6_TR41268/c0_g1_i2/m.62384/K01426/E3.5.1.4, amiE; amidase